VTGGGVGTAGRGAAGGGCWYVLAGA
jgi:hypothetical protein